MGATVSAVVAGLIFSVHFRCFLKKGGPGFEPVFGPEIPARKLGFTSFSRAATASVGGVVGPSSGPEPGPIFFEIPWFPGNFEGLQCAGGVRIPFLTLGRSWMGCLGGPTFRYLCVETARAVAWISPVWGQWGSRAGGLKARFGSAGRGGEASFQNTHFLKDASCETVPRAIRWSVVFLCVRVRRRHLCVETARVVAWVSPVWGLWGSRAGRLKAHFGSAGRGEGFA